MRILLVNSPLGRVQKPVFPLGLAYVASALNNHEVICFDAALEDDPLRGLSDIVTQSRPDVIGVSLRNIDTCMSSDRFSYWPAFVGTARHLKECSADATMVVGGSGFNLFPQTVMERVPELDFGIHLEGEESFPELLLQLGQPESVKGVYYRLNGRVMFSGAREPLGVDRGATPRRDILDLSAYDGLHGIGVQTKRGCAHDCLYCTYPLLTGRHLRLRSPEDVGEELEMLSKVYGRTEVFFSDNVFNNPPSHATAILWEIVRRKLDIRWTAYLSEKGITRDFVELALESGCARFTFAPDGSNDASLATLGKAVSRRELESTYHLLEGFPRAKLACSFVWNYPGAGWKDFRDLVGLVLQLVRMKNLADLGFSALRIVPNTRLHQIALAESYVAPEDDLLSPVYYDPPPWNSITALARMLRSLRRVLRPGNWRPTPG